MKNNKLIILLSLLMPFTLCAKESSKVTLKEGINALDINGDGINDLVGYSKFENNTSHPNHAMTIFVTDRQGNGDNMSDDLSVKFTRYDMNTGQDSSGVSLYFWEYKSAYITAKKYADIDEAFTHFQVG